jgi:recombination protein RecR
MLPRALQDVIDALGRLPGVGQKTAERYAYHLLKTDPKNSQNISSALSDLHSKVKFCPVTFALIDNSENISPLYSDPSRDKATVLVVEEPLDIYAIEQTRAFRGVYHVLGGAVSPIDGVTPDKLRVAELLDRLESDAVEEVILATNPSVEGEATALLLQKMLSEKSASLKNPVKVTRLARGLPLGVDLSYADQITLSAALSGRAEL